MFRNSNSNSNSNTTTSSSTFRRFAAAASIAAVGLVGFGAGSASAEDGPVCEEPDPSELVCEDDGPRTTIVSPDARGFVTGQIVLQIAF